MIFTRFTEIRGTIKLVTLLTLTTNTMSIIIIITHFTRINNIIPTLLSRANIIRRTIIIIPGAIGRTKRIILIITPRRVRPTPAIARILRIRLNLARPPHRDAALPGHAVRPITLGANGPLLLTVLVREPAPTVTDAVIKPRGVACPAVLAHVISVAERLHAAARGGVIRVAAVGVREAAAAAVAEAVGAVVPDVAVGVARVPAGVDAHLVVADALLAGGGVDAGGGDDARGRVGAVGVLDPAAAVADAVVVPRGVARPLVLARPGRAVAVGRDAAAALGPAVVAQAVGVHQAAAAAVALAAAAVLLGVAVGVARVPAGVDAAALVVADALLVGRGVDAAGGEQGRALLVAVGVGDPAVAVADAVPVPGGVAGPAVGAGVGRGVAVGIDPGAGGGVGRVGAVGVHQAAAAAVADAVGAVLDGVADGGVPVGIDTLVVDAPGLPRGGVGRAGGRESDVVALGVDVPAPAVADAVAHLIEFTCPFLKK